VDVSKQFLTVSVSTNSLVYSAQFYTFIYNLCIKLKLIFKYGTFSFLSIFDPSQYSSSGEDVHDDNGGGV
jgi:hypothetical protein